MQTTQYTQKDVDEMEIVFKNQKTQTRALALSDLHDEGEISEQKYINEIESLKEELSERGVL